MSLYLSVAILIISPFDDFKSMNGIKSSVKLVEAVLCSQTSQISTFPHLPTEARRELWPASERHLPGPPSSQNLLRYRHKMSQDPFSQYMRQLQQRAAGGRPGGMPGGRGLFAGSGLLIALVAGGFALNASLFNGAWYRTNIFR